MTMRENAYYHVTAPFPIDTVIAGHEPANVWIGRSQVLQTLYATVEALPGDELHLLVGGNFLVRGDSVWEFHNRRGKASDVMLHYSPPVPLWQPDPASVTPALHPRKPANGYRP